jgi:hypothetical protein
MHHFVLDSVSVSAQLFSVRLANIRSAFMPTFLFGMTIQIKTLLLIGGFLLLHQVAYAEDATWIAHPVDNNCNNPANWSTGAVPSEFDNATFDISNIRDVSATGHVTGITDVIFDSGAGPFTITALPGVLFVFNGGIVNNSGVRQNFVGQNSGDDSGAFLFNGDSDLPETITGPVTFTQQATNTVVGFAGFVQFLFAGAGDATFHNLGASVAGGTGSS